MPDVLNTRRWVHAQQSLAADAAPTALPLAHNFREWNAAWKRGEALSRRIEQELEFRTFLDILPSNGNLRAVSGKTGSGLNSLSYERLHEFLSYGDPFRELNLRHDAAVPRGRHRPEPVRALAGG